MTDILLVILIAISLAILALVIVLLNRQRATDDVLEEVEDIRRDMDEQQSALRIELADTVQRSVKNLGDMIADSQSRAAASQTAKLADMDRNVVQKQETLQRAVDSAFAKQEERLKTFAVENEQKLELIRATVEKKLSYIQEDNNKKLDEMRRIVDEKLQKTLEERMTHSFNLVSEQLDRVQKGLGEMQNLAVGVGDLKKVLSNVKTRGIVGEIQLGAILAEILPKEQYDVNVATVPNSSNRVEFAIKLPADNGDRIYLPIDSKFPMDAYTELMDAYESAQPERVAAAAAALRARLMGFGKDIRDKYISPPDTTEFGIMFLPTEGLYAEAVKLGLVEQLQSAYRVNISGPSTMAALLNSLQMGFRSVAIQKRSGEVWKVLGAVKTEFERFGAVLQTAQSKLDGVNKELDALVGTRTRQINRKLRSVTELPEFEVKLYLPDADARLDDRYDDNEED